MSNMKIELPGGQPERKKEETSTPIKKTSVKKPVSKPTVRKKVSADSIQWRDNKDTLSAKIGGKIIHIDIKSFCIELRNGFKIKCKSLEEAKAKAISLFNN